MVSKCSRVLARFKEIELGENKIKFKIKSIKNEELIEFLDKHKNDKKEDEEDEDKDIGEGLKSMDEIVFMFLKRDDKEMTMKEASDLDLSDKILVANTGMEMSGMGKNIFDLDKVKDESKKKMSKTISPQPSKVQSLKQELLKEAAEDSE